MAVITEPVEQPKPLSFGEAARAVPQVIAHTVTKPRTSRRWIDWVTTTDHKKIGIMYLVLTFVFFMLGGVEALLMRLQLAQPDNTLLTGEHYNELLTLHGTTMVFLFVVPVMAGFGNYFVPLMIGARDMAFPRLNALSFWLLLFGGVVFYCTLFFHPPEAGWWSYPPLSSIQFSPSGGQDAWIFLIHLTGISSLLGAINFYATIVNMRAPGMSWGRMPLFVWTILVYAILLIIALPVVAAAVTMLLTDRHFGTHFFDPTAHGSPVLWQHLFWFFGHPEVYIMILPGFGIISEVIPVFTRKPIFGYKAIAASTAVIAFLAVLVWGAPHVRLAGADRRARVLHAELVPDRGSDGRQDLQLDRDAVARLDRDDGVAVLRGRLHRDLHRRRDHRDLPGGVPGRLAAQRHLLRRRALPLRADGRRRVLDLRRDLLLVPEDDRPAAQRDARQVVVLGDVHRLQHDVLRPARARALGDAAADLHLPAGSRLVDLQLDLDDRIVHPRCRHPDDDRQHRAQLQARRVAGPDPWKGNTLEWFVPSPPPVNNFDTIPRVRSVEPMRDIRRQIERETGVKQKTGGSEQFAKARS